MLKLSWFYIGNQFDWTIFGATVACAISVSGAVAAWVAVAYSFCIK